MELLRYLAILRRRGLLILLTVIVAVGITAVSADRTSKYTTQTTLYIGANAFSTGDVDPNLSGDRSAGLTRLILTFSVMIDSASIASTALDLTGLPRSTGSVVAATTANPVPGTNILQINVTDTDPAVAQGLANGIADAFINKISELEPDRQLEVGDLPTAPARVFERAKLPTVPQQVSLISGLMVAGLIALLASGGVILLIEYLDVTVKGQADAEATLELPVLGVIPILTLEPSPTAGGLDPSNVRARR